MNQEANFFLPQSNKGGYEKPSQEAPFVLPSRKRENHNENIGEPNQKEKEEREKGGILLRYSQKYQKLCAEKMRIEDQERPITGLIRDLQHEGFQTLIDEYGTDRVFHVLKEEWDKKSFGFSTFDIVKSLETNQKKREELYEKMTVDSQRKGEQIDEWDGETGEINHDQWLDFRFKYGSGGNFSRAVLFSVDEMRSLESVSGKILSKLNRNNLSSDANIGRLASYIYCDNESANALKEQLSEVRNNSFHLVEKREKAFDARSAENRIWAQKLHDEISKEMETVTSTLNHEFEAWRSQVMNDLEAVSSDKSDPVFRETLAKVEAEIADREKITKENVTQKVAPFRNLLEEIEDNFLPDERFERLTGKKYVDYRQIESDDSENETLNQENPEKREVIAPNALLEVQTAENETIAFSEFNTFNPSVIPTEQTYEISESARKYFVSKEKLEGSHPSALTYQRTKEEKGWERNLFSFVSSYFQDMEENVEVMRKLGIERLDMLTPKQAIELSTRIVMDLTKYKQDDAEKQWDDHLNSIDTEFDKMSVRQILQAGLDRKSDANWEGNGVCRNFASCVKAVFESLKECQTEESRLRNTYCLYEGGLTEFAPKRQKRWTEYMNSEKVGHAWNTFFTLQKEGSTNATIVDVTWAKKNLETKEAEGLDHTLIRMEPFVYMIGRDIQNMLDKESVLSRLLSYYDTKIHCPSYTLGVVENVQEAQFFSSRALELMMKQGVPKTLSRSLAESIFKECEVFAGDLDINEIEALYDISCLHFDLDFHRVFSKYLSDRPITGMGDLIVKNDDLQRLIFEKLKLSKDFDHTLKNNPKFRSRMRSVLPQLFVGFFPWKKQEDAVELKYLLDTPFLSRYRMKLSGDFSRDTVENIFREIREVLRNTNPNMYSEIVGDLSDYDVIKQYSQLYRKLKG